jgi:death on curing protein
MKIHDYLTLIEVLEIHKMLIEEHGGAHGLRDAGALEAALFRPQSGYYDDLIAEASALFESLAINHPFLDGNKRIAFAATDIFLRINGSRIYKPPMDIYSDMMKMFDTGTFNIAHIEPWLRSCVSTQQSIL